MSLLGCRVVRGPDWKWAEQDGDEGGVGTIVSLRHFSDGRTLPSKTVLVCWDTGCVADYRVGLNGCYDLRVFDSAPAGVSFPAFTCDGCMQSNIAGMRWHCTQCNNFDLCNVCYMNDVHNKEHVFERYDISNDRTNGTKVGPRSKATKVRAKGLFPGAEVKRGRDWSFDSELGNMTGLVVGLTAWEGMPRSAVIVKWGQSLETPHRVGHQGKVDLQVVTTSQNAPFYYKEHLQIATSVIEYKRNSSTSGGEKLNEGDRVTIHLDVETLKLMSEGHGGWVLGMEKAVGKVGKIDKIDADGDVHVDFGLMRWAFHPEALVKVRDLRPGDKVRVLENKDFVMRYQEGHGGWNNAMEAALGQQGIVIDVDKDGDAIVNVTNQRWLFNAAALVLESKEEERQPPGVRTGTANASVEGLVLNALLEGLTSRLAVGHGIEPLVLASTLGDLDKVKEIIQKDKTLINQKSAGHKTALHVACHQGNPEIVSYLLGSGADKDIRDEGGYTALHHAAYGDKSGACVVIMLSANANVNAIDGADKTKVTPLHLAIQQDNEKAVVALTQFKHCDVNLQDKAGDTPLHCTILLGQTKNAKTILDARRQELDPAIFNEKGFNVLHLACIKNCTEVASILIERYLGLVDMVKGDGFSPLHLAALNNRCDIARMLLLSGHCDINMTNKEGRTPLSIAVGDSYKSMIELLIEHGANINLEDNDGDTPLHLAVMKHCMSFLGLDLAQLLGVNSAQNENNVNLAIALFLVVRGADVNHRNHQDKTPLDLCVDKRLQNMLIKNTRHNSPAGASSSTSMTAQPRQPVPPKQPTRPPTLPSASSSTLPSPPPVPSTAGITTILNSELRITPKPVEGKTSANPGPTSPEAVVPPSLAEGGCRESNNVNPGVSAKKTNNQISSEIQASAEQTVVQTQNLNLQAEKRVSCRYCEDEPATVVFEPCKHKVVCQSCSFRAKKCLLCEAVIENKTVPGEQPYRSLTDFKRNFEDKCRELREKCEEMERLALCQICMERPSNVVFLNCGHKACQQCSQRLRRCHSCNRNLTDEEKRVTYQ